MAFDADGRPLAGGNVGLEYGFKGPGFRTSTGFSGAAVKDDGSFAIEAVAPGEYILRTTRRANADTPGAVSIAVTGEDMTGIVIRTTPGDGFEGDAVDEDEPPPSYRRRSSFGRWMPSWLS
jgi:hypothetical protein